MAPVRGFALIEPVLASESVIRSPLDALSQPQSSSRMMDIGLATRVSLVVPFAEPTSDIEVGVGAIVTWPTNRCREGGSHVVANDLMSERRTPSVVRRSCLSYGLYEWPS